MAERELPHCPICDEQMGVLETNNSFFICRGDRESEKRHFQDILYSTKFFSNGHKSESEEIKTEKTSASPLKY